MVTQKSKFAALYNIANCNSSAAFHCAILYITVWNFLNIRGYNKHQIWNHKNDVVAIAAAET
jgi:hypothetical protein